MPAKTAKKPALGKGKIGFKVSNRYPVSIGRVWAAVTEAKHVQKFFVDKVAGDFTAELSPVTWEWKEWGRHSLWPTVVRKEKVFEFHWLSHNKKYLTTVTFTLKRKGKLTELEIHERGWTQADLDNAFDNCSGWTMYLDYLKAYLLHGVNLRTKVK
jgi:uncharacterized protein YndB with AHSA1/START domain